MRSPLKPISNFPDYFADRMGNVWSMKPNGNGQARPVKPKKLKHMAMNVKGVHRYNVVNLVRDGNIYPKKVSFLILTTFVSPRPHGMLACHGKQGSLIDTLDNLSWGTPSKNCLDKVRDGTMWWGEKHHRHKVNELQVRIIRRTYSPRGMAGISARHLGRIFGLDKSTVLSIIHGESWKYISTETQKSSK